MGHATVGPRARTRHRQEVDVTLLIVLALLIGLDLVAWRWGHDSRDGQDWRPELGTGTAGERGRSNR
jgi:hypothetical protein